MHSPVYVGVNGTRFCACYRPVGVNEHDGAACNRHCGANYCKHTVACPDCYNVKLKRLVEAGVRPS